MNAEPLIHPTAIVHPSAKLHQTAQVGPYTVIGADVSVGADTWIGPHVVLNGPMTIGERNRIFQFASLGEVSQDMTSKLGDDTRVEIGDDNVIREYVTIQRGTLKDPDSGGVTRVGSHNWIMNYVHFAHDSQVGSHCIIANNASLAGHVTLEDYVGLGGFTLIHQFCRIGTHAFTGGGSVLRRDVPPFVIMQGHPAEPRGINSEGLKRRGFSSEDIEPIKEAYKLIYSSGLVMAEVKLKLEEMSASSAEVGKMLGFIEKSKRSLQR